MIPLLEGEGPHVLKGEMGTGWRQIKGLISIRFQKKTRFTER